jgi:hypothetical protein
MLADRFRLQAQVAGGLMGHEPAVVEVLVRVVHPQS